MEQQRGNHETKWKTPIIQEGTDGSLNDDNDNDDDDDNNNKSTITRPSGPSKSLIYHKRTKTRL